MLHLSADLRPRVDGKFLSAGGSRFLVKGVSYGTFSPDASGAQFPTPQQIAADFGRMCALGINTVRVYTPPPQTVMDEAARHGLRVMIGVPWAQHVAFLDDRHLMRRVVADVTGAVRALADHPATLLFAVGNEIPPGVVRWHGRARVERFLRHLYVEAKSVAPGSILTYVNFPPTEYLDLSFLDVCAFNVYLHREHDLRAYLARLQQIAAAKPLLLAEAGADSLDHGEAEQAALTAMQVRAAFVEGLCGAVVFSWTDDWWRGGAQVADWAFGLVDSHRRPKAAAAAVSSVLANAPFPSWERTAWPKVSVVVCARNAERTLDDCLRSLARLTYPQYEVLLVNDGSTDRTGAIGRMHSGVRVIDVPAGGLSAARNIGLAHATGAIVAYTDADARVDPDWLTYLVQPLLHTAAVGVGGPNVVPDDDPWLAQCVARAPGSPTHVLLNDRTAEHVPGVNMAFRREALAAIGGFDATFVRAGDDVDVCWRLQERGWTIGFAPSALVWHHHRQSVAAYWRQQVGYGEGERWLMARHPARFQNGRMVWQGRIYAPLTPTAPLSRTEVHAGRWGTAAFPSVYRSATHPLAILPQTGVWQMMALALLLIGALLLPTRLGDTAAAATFAAGLSALLITAACHALHAAHADVSGIRAPSLARATIAWLFFVQPLARAVGRLRGMMRPPRADVAPRVGHVRWGAAWWPERRALLLITGSIVRDEYWSETAVSVESFLHALVGRVRAAGPRRVEIDEGWEHDRDVSVAIGRLAWLDVRALVEDHSASERPRSLLRVAARFRLTSSGVAIAVALAAASVGVAVWPAASWTGWSTLLIAAIVVVALGGAGRIAARAKKQIDEVAAGFGLLPVRGRPDRSADAVGRPLDEGARAERS